MQIGIMLPKSTNETGIRMCCIVEHLQYIQTTHAPKNHIHKEVLTF